MQRFNFAITQSNVGILTVYAHVYITYPLTVNTGIYQGRLNSLIQSQTPAVNAIQLNFTRPSEIDHINNIKLHPVYTEHIICTGSTL